jgi:molybdate transport system substrate-binding protein
LLLLAVPAGAWAQTTPVHVFAAATLKGALDTIAADWRQEGGGGIVIACPASPALAKQIENGAPADIFISADREWMDYLAERALIRPESRADLLSNRLVLIARHDSPLATTIRPGFPLASLIGDGRLAMCNPMHHPAGRYGRASLDVLGVWPTVADKVAIAENVQVAVTIVERGDAPLAIVFATDAAGDDRVKTIGTFPADTHPPIVYPAALIQESRPDAARFFAYLKSARATAEFERLGHLILH